MATELPQNSFFTFTGADQVDDTSVFYYDVTLKVQMGSHKPGDTLCGASIDYEKGCLELYKDEVIPPGKKLLEGECIQSYVVGKFKLITTIGEEERVEPPTSLMTMVVDC